MKRSMCCLLLAACHGSPPHGSPHDASATIGTDAQGTGHLDADLPPSANADTGLIAPTLGPDYRELGPARVEAKVLRFEGTTCSFAYESFTPDTSATATRLVIAPGFALGPGLGSSREALRRLATQIASWGVTTLTVDLCTNGALIDHPKNGAAIAELGARIGGSQVLYAGFSAGGLDALIAAASATNTVAYLGLDAVDSNGLAKPALDSLDEPAHAVVGEPSQCNADENMLAQYKGRSLRVLKVHEAQHFTFEGAPCEGVKCALCSGGTEHEASAIRSLATSYVVAMTGLDPHALTWWDAGSPGFIALSERAVVGTEQ